MARGLARARHAARPARRPQAPRRPTPTPSASSARRRRSRRSRTRTSAASTTTETRAAVCSWSSSTSRAARSRTGWPRATAGRRGQRTDRSRGRGGSRSRPRPRVDPPRPEADEHRLRRGGSRQDRRLRDRARGRQGHAHRGGDAHGDGGVHVPEQAQGEPVTPASDVYSFGVILFRMLTGRLPFESPSAVDLLRRQLVEEPMPVRAARPDAPPLWPRSPRLPGERSGSATTERTRPRRPPERRRCSDARRRRRPAVTAGDAASGLAAVSRCSSPR